MTFRAVLALFALLPLAACAGPKSSQESAPDPLASLTFAKSEAAPASAPPAAANAYVVEFALERANGTRFPAPRIVAWAGQAAQIALGQDVEYVADFGGEMDKPQQEPIKRTIHDGFSFDVCAQRAADGGVTLGYRVALAKLARPIEESTAALKDGQSVTVQRPSVTEVRAQGARWVEPGVWAMVARLASPDATGPLLVLARVTPIVLDTLPPVTDALADPDLTRPMTGHTVHLRISAVRVGRDFPPGTVLDESAAPDVLKVAGGEILRDFEAYTCLDGRVRMTASAGPPPGAKAYPTFAAVLDDAGLVTITWNDRTASVRANDGRRFLAVAPVEGGGTAGVIVSVNADD